MSDGRIIVPDLPATPAEQQIADIGGQKVQYFKLGDSVPLPMVLGPQGVDGRPTQALDVNQLVIVAANQLSAVMRELIELRARIEVLEADAPPPLFNGLDA